MSEKDTLLTTAETVQLANNRACGYHAAHLNPSGSLTNEEISDLLKLFNITIMGIVIPEHLKKHFIFIN